MMEIISKSQMTKILEHDAKCYYKLTSRGLINKIKNILFTNPINSQHKIYQYVYALRHSEYHMSNSLLYGGKITLNRIYHTFLTIYWYYKLRRLSYYTGIQIPPHTCGSGLQIWHYGYIIINEKTRIGKNLTIYPGVEIGHKIPGEGCPVIGDNCFIGAGAKIFGSINIGNNVTIAANAVVLEDIPHNAIVGGVPAKIIKIIQ